jgi:hypothetical protein
MSLIKSNSALVAFDEKVFSNSEKFIFLNFIQSISFDISSNRIKSKHIGSATSLVNQFTNPEVNLNLTFLQRKDFLNEMLFGMNFASTDSESQYFFKNLVNNFYNLNCFILFNDINANDLIYSNINSSMSSVSIGNLYLNNYSISYKINQLLIVSVDFLCGDLKIEKILNNLLLKNWNDSNIQLTTSYVDDLKLNTANAESLIYVMSGLSMSNTFNEKTFTPGVAIDSLLNGVIQSLDVSFELNRSKLYFFENTNSVSSRKIVLPINGSLKITGISYNINIGNLNNFFNNNLPFDMYIDMLDEAKEVFSKVVYENLIVEKFSYSININGMLEYSLDCSFQATDNSGYKVITLGQPSDYFAKLLSSNSDDLKTADEIFLYARN